MDHEGETTCAKFLDKEVAEEVVVARKVLHVHNLGGSPCALEDGGGGACDRGRHCEGEACRDEAEEKWKEEKGGKEEGDDDEGAPTRTETRTSLSGQQRPAATNPATPGQSTTDPPVRPASHNSPAGLGGPCAPRHRTRAAPQPSLHQPSHRPHAALSPASIHAHTTAIDGAYFIQR